MLPIRGLVALVVASLAVTAFAPAAEANHCGPIIIFGRAAQAPTGHHLGANAGGVGCIALGEEAPDVREITPGSPNLHVRFIGSFGGVASLSGHITGLGLDQPITLLAGSGVYESAYLPIDPLATGDVTASVSTPNGLVTVTFHKSA